MKASAEALSANLRSAELGELVGSLQHQLIQIKEVLENETEAKNTLNNKLVDIELESDMVQVCKCLC